MHNSFDKTKTKICCFIFRVFLMSHFSCDIFHLFYKTRSMLKAIWKMPFHSRVNELQWSSISVWDCLHPPPLLKSELVGLSKTAFLTIHESKDWIFPFLYNFFWRGVGFVTHIFPTLMIGDFRVKTVLLKLCIVAIIHPRSKITLRNHFSLQIFSDMFGISTYVCTYG